MSRLAAHRRMLVSTPSRPAIAVHQFMVRNTVRPAVAWASRPAQDAFDASMRRWKHGLPPTAGRREEA